MTGGWPFTVGNDHHRQCSQSGQSRGEFGDSAILHRFWMWELPVTVWKASTSRGKEPSALERLGLENTARLRKDDIGKSSSQRRADLIPQSRGLRLLHAAIGQCEVATANVEILVPSCVDGGPEKDAPLRVETATAADHVPVARQDGLRLVFACFRADKVTDVDIARHKHPVGGRLFGSVCRANKNARRAKFIGTYSEIVRPIGRSKAAAVCGRDIPRVLVAIVVCPHPKAQTDLSQIIHAGDSFGLGFGGGQRGKQQARQNGDDGNDHQQLDERKTDSSIHPSHNRLMRPRSAGRPEGLLILSANVPLPGFKRKLSYPTAAYVVAQAAP